MKDISIQPLIMTSHRVLMKLILITVSVWRHLVDPLQLHYRFIQTSMTTDDRHTQSRVHTHTHAETCCVFYFTLSIFSIKCFHVTLSHFDLMGYLTFGAVVQKTTFKYKLKLKTGHCFTHTCTHKHSLNLSCFNNHMEVKGQCEKWIWWNHFFTMDKWIFYCFLLLSSFQQVNIPLLVTM